MMRKREKVRLIDDEHFAIKRVKPRERKPDEAVDSKAHRDWIATLRCHSCGAAPGSVWNPVWAAHLRKGAGQPKSGDKKDDFWCWPGCEYCHIRLQHVIGEDSFWEGRLGDKDRWRTVLERYGKHSPVAAVRAAAEAEWERRYAS